MIHIRYRFIDLLMLTNNKIVLNLKKKGYKINVEIVRPSAAFWSERDVP